VLTRIGASSVAGVPDTDAEVVQHELLRADLVRAHTSIDDLKRELAATAESTAQVPDDEHDAEGCTVGYERARVGALLVRAQRNLDELTAALDRVATGTYWRCERCQVEIPVERLAALPSVRTCVTCAATGPSQR
jgi:DnaK suppressor protein